MSKIKKLIINSAARSIAGEYRGTNEDNIFFNGDYISKELLENDYSIKTAHPQDVNIYGVFDGMGKRGRGSLVSGLAAQRLSDVYTAARNGEYNDIDDAMLEYINGTNEAVGMASRRSQFRCGTAFAALYVDNLSNSAVAYNLGDCKIYMLRDKELFQISRDHSLISRERFAEAEFDNNISQFFGIYETEGELEPFRSKKITIQNGDKFLLCSDGVSDNIPRGALEEMMTKNKDPYALANELCQTAEANGSKDNMSAVVVTVRNQMFKFTDTAKAIVFGILIFLAGFIIGCSLGYLFGSASYGKTTLKEGMINSVPAASNYEISSRITDEDIINSMFSDNEQTYISSSDDEHGDESSDENRDESNTKEVKKLRLNKSDITINYYESYQFKVTFSPSDASEPLEWISNDPNIVTVDENGLIKGVGTGYTEITVKGRNSGKSAMCVVRVKVDETAVTKPKTAVSSEASSSESEDD